MDAMERKIICIRCPRGCELDVTLDEHGEIAGVTGNFCRLGKEHAAAEIHDPRRTVTSVILIRGGAKKFVPVWTEKPVPKDRIFAVIAEIRSAVVDAPLNAGETVIGNVAGTGIPVITSDRADIAESNPGREQ
jgi:CxxC motif-containing protein